MDICTPSCKHWLFILLIWTAIIAWKYAKVLLQGYLAMRPSYCKSITSRARLGLTAVRWTSQDSSLTTYSIVRKSWRWPGRVVKANVTFDFDTSTFIYSIWDNVGVWWTLGVLHDFYNKPSRYNNGYSISWVIMWYLRECSGMGFRIRIFIALLNTKVHI